jgi:hypothetical protein
MTTAITGITTSDVTEGDAFIGPFADNLINSFVNEVKKKKNKDKIMKNIIEPILNDINDKYYPHMLTLTILLSMIIILLLMVLVTNKN